MGPYRLIVAVQCLIGGRSQSVAALLDIGSEWCVMSREQAEQLGLDLSDGGYDAWLSTRFGTIHGRMERETVCFLAYEGLPLEVQATWFVSADWDGPTVIGWKGCLERIRFALDPRQGRNDFYFADAEEADVEGE
jgi:hypothetical protein